MISHFRNILNLNEKYAYSSLGRIRELLLPIFNNFLGIQEKQVRNRLSYKIKTVKNQLLNVLPEVRKEDLLQILKEDECNLIISKANKILSHEFNLLGTKISFKDTIDWHVDFNSGFKWPKGKLYNKYIQVNSADNADVKFPRELSRCHHFLTLGEAYILTNDEKYTKEFIFQIKNWIKENPYKKSINWGCSMDIAIRASNWMYGLRMFQDSYLIDDDFIHEIITSLFLHGRFIYENPEKNRVYNHNHYLSDLAGQILIGILFDSCNINETELWKKNGIYDFFREIRIQILPTGFSYERTTNYHRLVTELITYTIVLLKNYQIEIPQDIYFRIKKMFDCIRYYSFSDGTVPIIGDQDNGRYLPFYSYNINYQKYLLNVGATLFSDGVFKKESGANKIDVIFLFGKKGIKVLDEVKTIIEKINSKSFPDVGFYVMRSEKVFLFINNSGLGHYSEVIMGTHTHSDLLSFVYSYNNVPFLIDPGTYVYSSNAKERKKFRSTSMHNTITIDDKDQNKLLESDLWSIDRNAIPKNIIWETSDEIDIYEGSHTGYERLADPIGHFRRFELNKSKNKLVIKDYLRGKEEHVVKCHFHFDKNVEIEIKNKIIYCTNESENIKISFQVDTNYSIESKEEFISKEYNKKELAPYIVINLKMKQNLKIETIIEKNYDI